MATIVFSTLYHLADTIDNTVLGMTEGNWHRLDNIFAILSFVSVQLYVLDATIDSQTMQQVRTGFLLLTVLLQEIGPWRLECTLIPVLASSAVLAIYLYKNQPIRASLSRNPEGAFSRAFALLGLGVMGFVKGLDEDTDWLRIAHGCWHLFTGLSFYYFAKGLHHVVEEHQAKRQF
ncbi:Hypothetical Protein FCC1311_000702 [Hondaea fermentalgiana]|uniref:Uncharacterized protein n=1 Tax=Hondaea fermentalgiana TaxID=2315210 RepID=A0A2R5FYP6_9STRA|nr:Hypothetical Protein FCC1311_000702 [Hondaea fermentalgiana]|eukprot:GBG23850.1 Hypothetical Protein FCC1311_000702 [Hondaea fermentalgiana]